MRGATAAAPLVGRRPKQRRVRLLHHREPRRLVHDPAVQDRRRQQPNDVLLRRRGSLHRFHGNTGQVRGDDGREYRCDDHRAFVRERTGVAAGAAGPADRGTGGAARAVRDEHAGRN